MMPDRLRVYVPDSAGSLDDSTPTCTEVRAAELASIQWRPPRRWRGSRLPFERTLKGRGTQPTYRDPLGRTRTLTQPQTWFGPGWDGIYLDGPTIKLTTTTGLRLKFIVMGGGDEATGRQALDLDLLRWLEHFWPAQARNPRRGGGTAPPSPRTTKQHVSPR